MTSTFKGQPHYLTIPKHSALKTGTLNSILADVADYLAIPKIELLRGLFG